MLIIAQKGSQFQLENVDIKVTSLKKCKHKVTMYKKVSNWNAKHLNTKDLKCKAGIFQILTVQ